MSLRGVGARRWTILAVLLYLQMVSSGIQIGVAVASAKLLELPGHDWRSVSLILGALSLGITAGLMPWGWISDVCSERFALLSGFGGASVGLAACTFLTGELALVGGLALTGFFLASSLAGGSALLRKVFPFEQRGLAFGIRMTGGPLGGLLTSMAAPVILQHSISALLGVFACATVLAVLLVYGLIPSQRNAQPEVAPREAGHPARVSRWPRRTALHLPLLLALISAITQTSFVFTVTLGPQYLDQHLRLGGEQIGYVLAIGQLGGGVGRLALGRLADRARSRVRVAFGAVTLVLLGSAGVVGFSASNGAALVTAFCVSSVATQSAASVLIAMTTEVSPPRHIGVSVAMQQAAIGVVATSGPVLLGWVSSGYGWNAAAAVVFAVTFGGWLILLRLRSDAAFPLTERRDS